MKTLLTLLSVLALAPVGDEDAGAPPAVPEAPAELEGLILPYVTVELSSPVDGVVENFAVQRGDAVRKGQVVARLESSVEELTVAIAEAKATSEAEVEGLRARHAVAVSLLERQQALYADALVSEQAFEEARAAEAIALGQYEAAAAKHRVAQLEYERAKASLALRTTRSPVDGVVLERSVSEGEFVSQVTQLRIARIAQIDPLRVEIVAPKSFFGRIHLGQAVQVIPEGPDQRSFAARVTIVDPIVDAATGTFGVRVEFPNPEKAPVAGFRCSVRLP